MVYASQTQDISGRFYVGLHGDRKATLQVATDEGIEFAPGERRTMKIAEIRDRVAIARREAEAAAEMAALEAEALETKESKAATTRAKKAAAKKVAEDAEFDAAAPKRPQAAVDVDGETFIAFTRKTRNGDHLTVANPEAVGLDPEPGKWVTVCEKHSTHVYADTQKAARSASGIDFCDMCRDEANGISDMSTEFAEEV